MSIETLLKPRELAELLQVSRFTLAHWRRPAVASGPPYIQVGRAIRYRRTDVERWLRERDQTSAEPALAK